MDPNPPNGNGNPQSARKPESLGSVQQGRTIDFIDKLTECKPVIPDAVAMYVMRKNGLDTRDERIIRLISLATQKFISDIALDAMQLMRNLAFRFVRRLPPSKDFHVVDPYLDYRERLGTALELSLKEREIQVDLRKLSSRYSKWWEKFVMFQKDQSAFLTEDPSALLDVLRLPNMIFSVKLHQLEAAPFVSDCSLEHFVQGDQISKYLLDILPNAVPRSLANRVRGAIVEACNYPDKYFVRILEGEASEMQLVGHALPAQVAPMVRTTYRNGLPVNYVSFGEVYYRSASIVGQRSSVILLSVNADYETAVHSLSLAAAAFHNILKSCGARAVFDTVDSTKLMNFEAAAFESNSDDGPTARLSYIGPYVSERLNIRIESENSSELKFPHLNYCELNLNKVVC